MNRQNLIDEIEKGVKKANKHFIKNNIKAKAYKPINVAVEKAKPL